MTRLDVALIGAGRFAGFISAAAQNLPELAIRVVADPDRKRAQALADSIGADATTHWREAVSTVDAVVIATPPSTHAQIARTALLAGRHVFCEKPLAMTSQEAWELAELAKDRDRVLVVDHVLRYNPLLRALLSLQGELFGPLQRFCFENDASDEDLDPGHWFWDEAASGGIFVEHGVHFFDAAAMLIEGPATAVKATAARRTPAGPVDLVSATVLHGPDVLATHTHGFTHAHRCERQLMRLDYGTIEVRVDGWIPVAATLDGWTDDAGAAIVEGLPERVSELLGDLPGASILSTVRRNAGETADARGRGKPLHIPHSVHAHVTLGGPAAKQDVYAASVRAALADLVRCSETGTEPVSNGRTAAAAVTVAEAAMRAAADGHAIDLSGAR